MSHISANGKFLYTDLTQEQNIKIVKQKVHKLGYLFRSKKHPNGDVSIVCRRKEDIGGIWKNIGSTL